MRDLLNTIDLETDEFGGAADGGTGDMGDTGETPAVEAGVGDEAGAAADSPTPTWAGPSQDEWTQAQQALSQLAQYVPVLGQLGAVLEQQDDEPLELDPLDPDSVRQAMRAEAEQALAERFGRYEPYLREQEREQGNQLIEARLAPLEKQLGGSFDHETAHAFAEQALRDPARRGDPDAALRRGAEKARAYEQRIGKEAVEAYIKEMEAIGNAPSGGGVNGAATETPDRPRTEMEAALVWASRP